MKMTEKDRMLECIVDILFWITVLVVLWVLVELGWCS